MVRSRTPLSIIQHMAAFAVIFLSIISSPRTALFVVSTQPNIPIEFVMLSLALADYAALLFILVSALRLIRDTAYRGSCTQTLNSILNRFGGWVWIALIAWVGLSTRWADNISLASFNALHILLALTTAIFLGTLVDGEGALRRLLWMLVASVIVQAFVGIAQVLVQGPLGLSALGEVGRFPWDPETFYRARGLTEHPNYLGGCLALGLFACLVLLRPPTAVKRVVPQVAILLIMGVLLGAMAGTLSRSAFVGTVIGALPLSGWALQHISRQKIILAGVGVTVVIAAFGAIALRGSIQNAETRLLGAREFFFSYSFKVIQQAPILGVGGGNLMVRIGANEGDSGQDLLPVHNVYLFVWAELGIPGTILFLAGCGIVLWRSRLWQVAQMSVLRIWGSAFLVMCTIMLFDNYFWAVDPHRMTFFWVLGVWWGGAVWSENIANQAVSSNVQTDAGQVPIDVLTGSRIG